MKLRNKDHKEKFPGEGDDRTELLDRIIQHHVAEKAEDTHQGAPVAAIAASDRLAWANQAGVEIDRVEERLYCVCEKVEPEQKHWAVPRFRLKSAEWGGDVGDAEDRRR